MQELRAAFPLVDRVAYLNAGTHGPVARASAVAAAGEAARELEAPRFALTERRAELERRLRAGYAALLGCAPDHVALTGSTTDGVAAVVGGLGLGTGDEVLTSDVEHAGVLGPLGALARRGVTVRAAPLARLPDAVGPRTRVVVCSHVSWASGALAPATLGGLDVPVLLDGAQGLGAIPVDVGALGCAAYAASGQKWLCGPDGTGALYVSPALRARLAPAAPGWDNLADPDAGLGAPLHPDARAVDIAAAWPPARAHALAALDVLSQAGWAAVHAGGATLAQALATELLERGADVLARDRTTLVAWRAADAPALVRRLAAQRVIVRSIPGHDAVRVSTGAWNDERDLDRLLSALDS